MEIFQHLTLKEICMNEHSPKLHKRSQILLKKPHAVFMCKNIKSGMLYKTLQNRAVAKLQQFSDPFSTTNPTQELYTDLV